MTDRRDDILDYLDGELDEAKQAELRDWLDQSPDHWDQFARLSFIHGAIGTQLRNEESITAFRIESLQPIRDLPPDPEPAYKTVAQAMAFILQQALTTKRIAITATAASLLLAATLFLFLQGSGPDTKPSNTAQSPALTPESSRIVATLTAEHEAVWGDSAKRALARGSALHLGDRLTLTAGFAEITTQSRTVVILEGPVTIELLDNNALRLEEGKLVGTCETESSKGFLVRTPHMDVKDLGTEFGVSVSENNFTASVFTGSIKLSRTGFQPQYLQANQTAHLETASLNQKLVIEDTSAKYFARAFPDIPRPNPYLLNGTGRAHADGEADSNWRVVAVDGQPITRFGELIVSQDHHGGVSDPETSQWLVINKALNPQNKTSAVFTCQSTLDVPATFDPGQSKLVMRCSADFSIKSVRINENPVNVPQNRIGVGDEWITLDLTKHHDIGKNTLQVDVYEIFKNNGNGNSSSLRVELEIQPRTPPIND